MINKPEARSLKDALYNTVHRHPRLSVEQIAEQLDIDANYLYRQLLPDADTDGPRASGARFMIKLLIPLIRVTGDFQALDFIERQLGRCAVQIQKPEHCNAKSLSNKAVDAAAEFGDLMRRVSMSLEDDKLTADEKKAISKEGYEAIQAILQVIMVCCKGGLI